MIIKSHIRGGYRSAADYMKDIGQNESTRLVELGVAGAATLDEAFHAMWGAAQGSRVKKPLHHISINPQKHERLTDDQVRLIIGRCEQLYGYHPHQHQRVVVEHIKEGRQHFHVIWNRVSLETGKAIWPGHHWLKSRHIARMMEQELGLEQTTRRDKTKTAAGFTKNPKNRAQHPVRPHFIPAVAAIMGGTKPLSGFTLPIQHPQPPAAQYPMHNPTGGWGSIGEEQRRDLEAAIEGRISWRHYFLKWGKGGLTL